MHTKSERRNRRPGVILHDDHYRVLKPLTFVLWTPPTTKDLQLLLVELVQYYTKTVAIDVAEHGTMFPDYQVQNSRDKAMSRRVNRKLDIALLPFLSLLYLCT